MIESKDLFSIQNALSSKDKSIPVTTTETDYILLWLLVGIAKSEMNNILTFKGGTALKKFYLSNYRFSEDLDFTLLEMNSIKEIKDMLEEVYNLIKGMANIPLALKKLEEHQNGYTFYLNFSGPLGADITKRHVKVDFTKNEKLIYKPIIKPLAREYKEYKDIPEDIELKVYPIKEIFIEKYLSILDKRRNEPRDLYDLWYLMSNKCLKYKHLGIDIKEKGKYKGISNYNIINTLNRKRNNYKSLWERRLETQIIDLPYFDRIFREIKQYLRPLNNILQNN